GGVIQLTLLRHRRNGKRRSRSPEDGAGPGTASRAVRSPHRGTLVLRGASLGWLAGEVGWCLRWLVLVDKRVPKLGIWLMWAGEVAPHDGEFGRTVGGQRPLSLRRRELACLCAQPRRVIGAVRQLAGQGGHLRAVVGGAARDNPVHQAASQRGGGTDRP